MVDVDSYRSNSQTIRVGEDEKGKYKLMQINYEVPCGCHPETCCCRDGKKWDNRRYELHTN